MHGIHRISSDFVGIRRNPSESAGFQWIRRMFGEFSADFRRIFGGFSADFRRIA
jgi:hypothetical protein